GAVLVWRSVEKELCGADPSTTNNRMELTAVISALSALKEPCEVTVVSDSKYVVEAMIEGWAESWERTNWKNGKAKNPDLWQKLLQLCRIHKVSFEWVRGHVGHPYNERCDKLATSAADNLSAQ
ncbi:MAG: ribonuclease HI, partial [Clostridia bacterium]|nr:ribonuclease HI [Clostridia bacterium]